MMRDKSGRRLQASGRGRLRVFAALDDFLEPSASSSRPASSRRETERRLQPCRGRTVASSTGRQVLCDQRGFDSMKSTPPQTQTNGSSDFAASRPGQVKVSRWVRKFHLSGLDALRAARTARTTSIVWPLGRHTLVDRSRRDIASRAAQVRGLAGVAPKPNARVAAYWQEVTAT